MVERVEQWIDVMRYNVTDDNLVSYARKVLTFDVVLKFSARALRWIPYALKF
jgi:hypothetical protein